MLVKHHLKQHAAWEVVFTGFYHPSSHRTTWSRLAPIAGAIQIQTTRRRTLRGGVDDGLKAHWRPQLYVQTLTVAATGVVVRVYIQQFQGTSQVFWISLASRAYTVFWMRTMGNAKSRNLRNHSVNFLVCIGDVWWGHFGSFSCTTLTFKLWEKWVGKLAPMTAWQALVPAKICHHPTPSMTSILTMQAEQVELHVNCVWT